MNQEILNELVTIKYLLIGLLITTGVPMVVIVLSRMFGFQLKGRPRSELFQDVAEALYSEGEYEGLISYAQKELDRNPKSAIAHWFVGKANYAQKNYKEAEHSFVKAVEINPSLEKEYVQPFLAKTQSHTNKRL